MITRRNPDREARLIVAALTDLDPEIRANYLNAASARLEAGQRLYGDRWAVTPVERLIGELIEEALDLACWSVLTRQRLDLTDLDPDYHRQLTEALTATIRAGAVAYSHLTRLDHGRAER